MLVIFIEDDLLHVPLLADDECLCVFVDESSESGLFLGDDTFEHSADVLWGLIPVTLTSWN